MAGRLRDAGIANAMLDARLLAAHALGLDTTRFVASEPDILTGADREAIAGLIARRAAGEPVARIVGEQEFYGLGFALNRHTLIPRPETELLVDLGIEFLRGRVAPRLLDLGTGTGCVAVALLHSVPAATGVATDLSAEAIRAARANAARHGVLDRCELAIGSWYEPVPKTAHFDLIVANPPYIAPREFEGLAGEVRLHDPRAALDGGADGLAAYREILAEAGDRLAVEGRLIVEIGHAQAEAVALICTQSGLRDIEVHHDLAGHARVVVARH